MKMKIFVKAKPNAKENNVTPPLPKLMPDDEEWYVVSVKERPVEGRANEAIAKILAKHFRVSRTQIHLISGANSKRKVFKINGL